MAGIRCNEPTCGTTVALRRMRIPRAVIALVTLLVFGFGGHVQAEMITIESASFAPGTNVSNLSRGVIVQRLTQPASTQYTPIVSPVIATVSPEGWAAVTFGVFYDMGFGHDGCVLGVPLSCATRSSVLALSFSAPTSFVQIVGDWWSDFPGMRTYDIHGNLLSFCNYHGRISSPECVEATLMLPGASQVRRSVLTITRPERDIGSVVWSGVYGAAAAHEITFEVPEPHTLLLVAVGRPVCFVDVIVDVDMTFLMPSCYKISFSMPNRC